MAPLLHIMRHGQGFHSAEVNKNGSQVRDAALTEKGKQQCALACREFGNHDRVDMLLASPLTRALQTCSLVFAPCVDRGMRIIALPMAEEASDAPSDTGREPDVLRQEFPDIVDFDHVKHGWYLHEGEYAITPSSLNARAAKLRRFIREQPHKEVVLVAHGFFNHYLTGEVNDKGEQTTPWWGETERRSYTFLDDGEEATINETKESLMRRGAVEDGLIINRPKNRGKDE